MKFCKTVEAQLHILLNMSWKLHIPSILPLRIISPSKTWKKDVWVPGSISLWQ
jgi:hypothetical protein